MIRASAVHGLLLASLAPVFVRWLCSERGCHSTSLGPDLALALDGDQGDDNDAKKCYDGDDDSCPKGSMLKDIDLDICE